VIKFQNKEVRTPQIRGVWAAYARTREVSIGSGRFFTETEDEHRIPVCVIGFNIADKLLQGYEPLGKEILIGNKVFSVIGVLEQAKITVGGPPVDSFVFIPYNVMRAIYPAQQDNFVALGAHPGKLETVIDEATELLRRRRQVPADKPNNFDITTPSGIIESFNGMLFMVSIIVIPLVSVALLVGGIGVANIMLVSVNGTHQGDRRSSRDRCAALRHCLAVSP
jgi:putative ABC transport system permease protein